VIVARYFDVHPSDPQPRLVAQVVAMLSDDALIAYPTDSCYALGFEPGATRRGASLVAVPGGRVRLVVQLRPAHVRGR